MSGVKERPGAGRQEPSTPFPPRGGKGERKGKGADGPEEGNEPLLSTHRFDSDDLPEERPDIEAGGERGREAGKPAPGGDRPPSAKEDPLEDSSVARSFQETQRFSPDDLPPEVRAEALPEAPPVAAGETPPAAPKGAGDEPILATGDEITIDGKSHVVVRRLGRGGMGEAYLVRYETKGFEGCQDLVCKLAFSKPNARRAFGDELALLMGAADEPHPNLLKMAGHGTIERGGSELPFMALERLFPLELLTSYDPGTALNVFVDILDGLIHLHTKLRYVHNDIKLANVAFRVPLPRMDVTDDIEEKYRQAVGKALAGGGFQAVILDYGSVTKVGEQAEKLMITPDHAAPDYFTDQDTWRKRDGYAATLVLFEMVTGRKPFVGANVRDVIDALGRGERPINPDDVMDTRFHEEIKGMDGEKLLDSIRHIVRIGTEPDPDRRPTPMVLREETMKRFPFRKRPLVLGNERNARLSFEGVQISAERNRYRSQLKRLSGRGGSPSTTTAADLEKSKAGKLKVLDVARTIRTRGIPALVVTLLAASIVWAFQNQTYLEIRGRDLLVEASPLLGLDSGEERRALVAIGAPATSYLAQEIERAQAGGERLRAFDLLLTLSLSQDPGAAGPLVRWGLTAPEEEVRRRSVHGLALIADLRTAAALLALARGDPSPDVRSEARRSLAALMAMDRTNQRQRGLAVDETPIPEVPTLAAIEAWWAARGPEIPGQIETPAAASP